MKVEEIKPRASEGDVIELEGEVFRRKAPNSNDFEGTTVWGQFIVLKDDTGEQGCWLKLDGEGDGVSKGSSIKIKGTLGKEYTEKRSGKLKRSINNCDFEVGKMQEPAQSSSSASGNGNGTKDNYWIKKFDWEVKRDKRVQYLIVRQCSIKCAVELSIAKMLPKKQTIFDCADEMVDYIYKKQKVTVEEEKEERIEEAREVVGETEFKPASTEQKNYIYGYRNNKDKWCKGIIESRYMETPERREIGAPEKLSLKDATEWLDWWWGPDKKSGERKKRELEHPRNEDGTLVGDLVEGNKTSIVKDDLVDDINAWRRENFLIDDKKFKEELGYSSNLDKLSEEDLLKIKDLMKHYHPKSWNGDEKS